MPILNNPIANKLSFYFIEFLKTTENIITLINDPTRFADNFKIFLTKNNKPNEKFPDNAQLGLAIYEIIADKCIEENYNKFFSSIHQTASYKIENDNYGLYADLLQITYYKKLHPEPNSKQNEELENLYRSAMQKNVKANYQDTKTYMAINVALAMQNVAVSMQYLEQQQLHSQPSLQISKLLDK